MSNRIATLLILITFLAGCATGPRVYTHSMPQVDFTNYQTFGWPEELGTDRGGYETHITQYFKTAVRREMEALGYRFVENDPDLLVNFFAHVEDKEQVYTRPSLTPSLTTGYYGYRYGMYTAWPIYSTEIDTFHYQLGTANVDLIDADEQRMIWEGRAEGRLTDRELENPSEAISDVVREIFERFPTRSSND